MYLQAFEDELQRRQTKVDAISQKGEELRLEGAAAILEPELTNLNRRLADVSNQVVHYRHPVDEPIQAERVGKVNHTPRPTSTSSDGGRSVSQFLGRLHNLLDDIANVQAMLQCPELHGKEFEDLNTQERLLKV